MQRATGGAAEVRSENAFAQNELPDCIAQVFWFHSRSSQPDTADASGAPASVSSNRGESLPLWAAACGGAAQVPGSVAHKANLFGAVKFQLLLLFSARCLRYAASLAFSLALASRTCSRVMDFSKPQLLYRASDKASSGRVPPAEFSGWATSIDRAATSLLSPGSGSMAATFGATSSIAVQASYSWKNRRCWGESSGAMHK